MIDLQEILTFNSSPFMYLVLALMAVPLFSFFTTGLFGKKAPLWASFLLLLNTGLAVYLLLTNIHAEPQNFRGQWFRLGNISITLNIMVDELMLIMSVIVNFISLLVHVFSMEYMKHDKRLSLYYRYLGLFTFSMMGIVLFYDLLLMFVFWELVGLSSFLLIGFWFEKKSASLAANKAFIMNRIGDAGFITGLMILFTQFQSFDLEAIKTLMLLSEIEDGNWIVHFMNNGEQVFNSIDGRWLSAAGIALFCGAVGKSAQFPLQIWLPDAMEGPTPVSALIHAATMVAAGVFMLARIFVILDAQALEVVAIVGAVTAFMAAIAALSQFDIKKVLAYSTISQLGYMVLAMGIGAYSAGLFHLITHAFFKAGLFLSAGIIIHQLHALEDKDVSFDPQDMRVMGGLRKHMPKTFFAFLFCSLALAGLPGFSGFLSKDAILLNLSAWTDHKGGGFYIPEVLAFATVIFTAFYTFRMIFLVFFGEFRLPSLIQDAKLKALPKDGNAKLMVPALLLGVLSLSLWFGFTLEAEGSWLYHLIETPVFLVPVSYAATSLIDIPERYFEALHTIIPAVSIGFAFIGFVLAYVAYKPGAKLEKAFVNRREPVGPLGQISFYHWYQDSLYTKIILPFILLLSRGLAWFDAQIIDRFLDGLAKLTVVLGHVTKWFDKYFVDGLVNLTAVTSGKVGQLTRSIQSGKVQTFVVMSFVFLLLILLLLMF
ncbi:NADH-quinone oxidoreductase subunit L [Roseivirga pacifica]|uniref:NADH-quinone oxidoreductase subunit L n=1 Tax=Roseivirga pacifica TaxID=1267423 RepID=UPI0020965C66|nr:NADH-quinone oxidoreductase subunit L [Roseivirga pacifica]MCO6358604.1 NADH-quinone oxidoreductase subunit L [Roseivirga pacifica]MCO6365760.1 NADH-quinone oxidoreductase subunit L [Roseivirga pacifica]MCO6371510.1 NADH-quinone oxidoreductase subunit L [Roseivirga pacifica]MCO6376379.1 NADH-quinone oxidoreductase subunit L [Roseivirga pacifica]MCO6378888.1 NADH-quinone oxidoreductase subunit L [Roseivirga pacifica]